MIVPCLRVPRSFRSLPDGSCGSRVILRDRGEPEMGVQHIQRARVFIWISPMDGLYCPNTTNKRQRTRGAIMTGNSVVPIDCWPRRHATTSSEGPRFYPPIRVDNSLCTQPSGNLGSRAPRDRARPGLVGTRSSTLCKGRINWYGATEWIDREFDSES